MVAYSFKARFAAPILARTKRQTLRPDRKRHVREGEQIQLYTAMRTRHCRLIGRATCLAVSRLELNFDCGRVESLDTGTAWTTLSELDAFAIVDGFLSWRAMQSWWSTTYPGELVWTGVRIFWGDTLGAAG